MEPWQEEALLQQRQQAYAEHQDETSRWYQDQDYLTTMQAQDREYMNLLLSMGYEPSDEELSRAGMTRGQAAALTGGYGNSYAQTAGQQTYQGYLQQLNNVVPELYGQAYNRYQAEGEALYNEALVYETLRQQAYAEHQDETSRWYQDQDYLTTMQAQDREYMNLLLSMGYEPSDEELSRAGMTRDQATILTDYYESVRNGDTSTATARNGGYGYDTHGYSEEIIKGMQELAGIGVDGIWGPETQRAFEAGYTKQVVMHIGEFLNKIHTETQHDAIERAEWGPYTQYVLYQILNDETMTDFEKEIVKDNLGVTESDYEGLRSKGKI